ncbi:MAG TPA: hypothetical protein VHC86_12485 [Opitutaceae bacterium]|nr:hypothetical protein [Opitutaceae bacterium]
MAAIISVDGAGRIVVPKPSANGSSFLPEAGWRPPPDPITSG